MPLDAFLYGYMMAVMARAATTSDVFNAIAEPQRRVAPGQSVVLYRGDDVLGGGIAS